MDTKGYCFPKSIIIQAVYLKLRFTLSYRDVEEILRIRGVDVDHATIQRWVFKFMLLSILERQVYCVIKKDLRANCVQILF